jgi:hypothetical protein
MEAGALTSIEKEYTLFSETTICRFCGAFKFFYLLMYNKMNANVRLEFDKRIVKITTTPPFRA